MQEMRVQSPGGEDPLEEEMVTHSSILAWRVAWTEGPGGLHTVHGAAKESDAAEHTQDGVLPHPFLLRLAKIKHLEDAQS